MNVTGLVKHPIMDLATASTIGQIDDVVVDPVDRRVVGFHLAKTPGKAAWLRWEQVTALGEDAATVATVDVLQAGDDAVGRRLRRDKVIGGRVLTDEGSDLGVLDDVEVDPLTGQIVSLSLRGGHVLPATALVGIGSYATVVVDPDRSARP